MARFGFELLVATALIAAAGCAHQPERTTTPPAPASATSLEAIEKDVSPRLLVFAHEQGFTQVVMKNNNYYFCKVEDPMGSIIPIYQCMDRTQLESLQQAVEQQRLTQLARQAAQTVHKGQ